MPDKFSEYSYQLVLSFLFGAVINSHHRRQHYPALQVVGACSAWRSVWQASKKQSVMLQLGYVVLDSGLEIRLEVDAWGRRVWCFLK